MAEAPTHEKKLKNTLPLYGNKESMNLNTMILTNIQSSPYFKEDLYEYKTFHEVVDQIYYKVEHLEPWEKNSRKLAGQVGMCAGVRGVAAGGIVSTPYCLLYKLFTLKLTRRQVTTMLNHRDSPYIRGLGFLYIRYCQPPKDFWDWLEPYISDEEEIDVKAGGGYTITIGEMVRMMLTKLDWFGTLFPRIPVNVQKELDEKIKEVKQAAWQEKAQAMQAEKAEEERERDKNGESAADDWGEAGRRMRQEEESRWSRSDEKKPPRSRSRSPRRRSRERKRDDSRDRRRNRSRERNQSRERSWERREKDQPRSRSRERREQRSRSKEKRERRSRSRERRERRSRERDRRSRSRERRRSRSRERRRSRDRRSRDKRRSRSRSREMRRSRSNERRSRHRSRSRDRK